MKRLTIIFLIMLCSLSLFARSLAVKAAFGYEKAFKFRDYGGAIFDTAVVFEDNIPKDASGTGATMCSGTCLFSTDGRQVCSGDVFFGIGYIHECTPEVYRTMQVGTEVFFSDKVTFGIGFYIDYNFKVNDSFFYFVSGKVTTDSFNGADISYHVKGTVGGAYRIKR